MALKAKETSLRRAHAARVQTMPGYVLIFVESNVPGIYYIIEEKQNEVLNSVRVFLKNAQEIWQTYGIDLYSTAKQK